MKKSYTLDYAKTRNYNAITIYPLVHPSKIPKCAKRVDKKCVREYAKRMRKDPNLCVNIPFKSECLVKGTRTCKADILTDLLDVFPYEANKVLAVFCQKVQDSG